MKKLRGPSVLNRIRERGNLSANTLHNALAIGAISARGEHWNDEKVEPDALIPITVWQQIHPDSLHQYLDGGSLEKNRGSGALIGGFYKDIFFNEIDVDKWVSEETLPPQEPEPQGLSGPVLINQGGRPSIKQRINDALAKQAPDAALWQKPQKKIAEVIAIECSETLGARGWKERTVISHVSEWIKENRSNAKTPET